MYSYFYHVSLPDSNGNHLDKFGIRPGRSNPDDQISLAELIQLLEDVGRK